jgi:hypothetical protein
MGRGQRNEAERGVDTGGTSRAVRRRSGPGGRVVVCSHDRPRDPRSMSSGSVRDAFCAVTAAVGSRTESSTSGPLHAASICSASGVLTGRSPAAEHDGLGRECIRESLGLTYKRQAGGADPVDAVSRDASAPRHDDRGPHRPRLAVPRFGSSMAPPTGSTRTSTSGASSAARRANDSAGSRRASGSAETDHAVRPPVNRDRHTRSQQPERLRGASRGRVAAPPLEPHPATGRKATSRFGRRAHAREEVGVAWEYRRDEPEMR